MDMNSAHHKAVNYALNGKIMLCSVIILLVVVFVVACFHSYVRLCFHRNHPRRRRRRRPHNSNNNIISSTAASINTNISNNKGLDLSVVKNLPSFVYSAATHDPLLECAVCLSEFEDGEQGRLLPNCSHAFHTECIDTWFQCHSNCPLCRSPVRPDIPVPDIAITVNEEAGTPSFSGVEYCAREALDLVVGEMSMDDRLRQFGTPKSHEMKFSGNNKILTLEDLEHIVTPRIDQHDSIDRAS